MTGSAEVFGYVIKAEYKPVELFSPGTSSLVTLSECGKEDSSTTTNVRKTLLDALQNQPSEVIKKALTRAKKASAVLLMRSVQSVEMNFVCSFQSFQDIFSLDFGKVHVFVGKTLIFPNKQNWFAYIMLLSKKIQ